DPARGASEDDATLAAAPAHHATANGDLPLPAAQDSPNVRLDCDPAGGAGHVRIAHRLRYVLAVEQDAAGGHFQSGAAEVLDDSAGVGGRDVGPGQGEGDGPGHGPPVEGLELE